ncbi:MAG: hypothetical protein J0H82_26240 [Alphaproteobacteria bacterium]|nr:hypothetical protein [Alphaproteobacteria bacterium]
MTTIRSVAAMLIVIAAAARPCQVIAEDKAAPHAEPASGAAGGGQKAADPGSAAMTSPGTPRALCYRQVWFGPAVVAVGDEHMLVPAGSMAAAILMSDGSEQTAYFGGAVRLAACRGGR